VLPAPASSSYRFALNPALAVALAAVHHPHRCWLGSRWWCSDCGATHRSAEAPEAGLQNPLRLGTAVAMALALQLALTLVAVVRQYIGETVS